MFYFLVDLFLSKHVGAALCSVGVVIISSCWAWVVLRIAHHVMIRQSCTSSYFFYFWVEQLGPHPSLQCLTVRCALDAAAPPGVTALLGPVLVPVSPVTLERLLPLLLRGAAACTPPRGVPGVAALVEER